MVSPRPRAITTKLLNLPSESEVVNRLIPGIRVPRPRDTLLRAQLMWSSYSTAPAVIPASALFYTAPISGSPYNISVVPGAAAYPFTEAFGEGVTNASAGVFASFVIQAKV